jgi:hypothetical protein
MDASTFHIATLNAQRAAERAEEFRILEQQAARRAAAAVAAGDAPVTAGGRADAYALAGPAR